MPRSPPSIPDDVTASRVGSSLPEGSAAPPRRGARACRPRPRVAVRRWVSAAPTPARTFLQRGTGGLPHPHLPADLADGRAAFGPPRRRGDPLGRESSPGHPSPSGSCPTSRTTDGPVSGVRTREAHGSRRARWSDLRAPTHRVDDATPRSEPRDAICPPARPPGRPSRKRLWPDRASRAFPGGDDRGGVSSDIRNWPGGDARTWPTLSCGFDFGFDFGFERRAGLLRDRPARRFSRSL